MMSSLLRTQVLAFILKALRNMHGMPMPEETLWSSVDLAFPRQVTRAESRVLAAELEAEGYVSAVSDPITGIHWSLTTKGEARASQL